MRHKSMAQALVVKNLCAQLISKSVLHSLTRIDPIMITQAPKHARLLLQIDGNSEVISNASHPSIILGDMVIYIFECLDSDEVVVIWQC